MVEICVHVLSVVVKSVFLVFCIAERKSRNDVRAIEHGKVFRIEKVCVLDFSKAEISTL